MKRREIIVAALVFAALGVMASLVGSLTLGQKAPLLPPSAPAPAPAPTPVARIVVTRAEKRAASTRGETQIRGRSPASDATPSLPPTPDTAEAPPATSPPVPPAKAHAGPSSGEKIFCERVSGWLSPQECAAAEHEYANTLTSQPHANLASSMYKGAPQQVTLSVGLPGEGANEAAQTAAQGPGEARIFPSARVGRQMKADLYGANFEVEPQTPETQVLTPSATWIWQVMPRAEGVQQLELRTAVIFADQSGRTYELASTPQLYAVTVKIQPKPPEPLFQRILDTLTGGEGLLKAIAANIAALAGIIAAVAGLRAAWKKLRGS